MTLARQTDRGKQRMGEKGAKAKVGESEKGVWRIVSNAMQSKKKRAKGKSKPCKKGEQNLPVSWEMWQNHGPEMPSFGSANRLDPRGRRRLRRRRVTG